MASSTKTGYEVWGNNGRLLADFEARERSGLPLFRDDDRNFALFATREEADAVVGLLHSRHYRGVHVISPEDREQAATAARRVAPAYMWSGASGLAGSHLGGEIIAACAHDDAVSRVRMLLAGRVWGPEYAESLVAYVRECVIGRA